MDEKSEPYRAGGEQARRDILAGGPRFFSGAPSRTAWARDQTETLHKLFGVEVTFVSDVTWTEERAFEQGYNATITEHVDSLFGSCAMRTALDGVQQRRKATYDRYFAERRKQDDITVESLHTQITHYHGPDRYGYLGGVAGD